MSEEKYGFVYVWYDLKHKRYYIGSHWGKEDDGYLCSSNWMRDAYKRRPNDFKRRILSRIYTNRRDTFNKEQEWLNLVKPEELGIKYYNLNNIVGHWTIYPEKVKTIKDKISHILQEKIKNGWSAWESMSEETRQKYIERMTGNNNPAKKSGVGEKITKAKLGVKRTVEQKERMSEAQKARTDIPWNKGRTDLQSSWNKGKEWLQESKNKMSLSHKGKIPWNKGKNCSEEIKEKISGSLKGRKASNKGIPHSEETKKKISETKAKNKLLREQEKIINNINTYLE